MHDSEYIGGKLERDILETPGVYVAVVASWSPDDGDSHQFGGGDTCINCGCGIGDDEPTFCGEQETVTEGWAIVYRDETDGNGE
jgi:hypothetical protein